MWGAPRPWWCALALVVACGVVRPPAPLVRTRGGAVRGRLARHGTHYVYFGVPYAAVDSSNRFQAPLPPAKWDGVLEAVDENIRCPQRMIGSIVVGDIDCLKLNIYTPVRARPDKLLPVMVFIHGGCFLEGTGSPFLYGGDYFVEHGVVFVGVNYRLNVEGFLCLGIKEAPGNAGLKDQIAALKWVKDNIKAFGGDPENVTLFGESAGAVSTSLMVMSPAAKGLFHKAILQSGSSLAPWAIQHDPIKTANSLVKVFGYDTKDPHEIYSILSKKTVSELINAIPYSAYNTLITAETLFVPCVENNIAGVEAVMTQHPADIIQSGNYTKMPMIIGFNDNEGIYFVAKDYGTSLEVYDPMKSLKSDLEFPTEKDRNMTAESIARFYFADKEDPIHGMVDLYSDVHFKFPSVVESQLYAGTTDKPIYYYLFKYGGYINMPKIISRYWRWRGASHADELFYMFKPHSFPLPQRVLETQMVQRMVTLWTNFAKYSDPTPAWSQLVRERWVAGRGPAPAVLVLDAQPQLATGDAARRLWAHHMRAQDLWNQTYARYGRRSERYGFPDSLPASTVVAIAAAARST